VLIFITVQLWQSLNFFLLISPLKLFLFYYLTLSLSAFGGEGKLGFFHQLIITSAN
jgi:hypothetical protein